MSETTATETSDAVAGRAMSGLLADRVPEPPEPPPIRLQCGACGYTAPKPEYQHTCWMSVALIGGLSLLPITALLTLAMKLMGR